MLGLLVFVLGQEPSPAKSTVQPGHVQLVPYHADALAGQTPLILVHGIAPDQGEYDNWGLFLKEALSDPGFDQRFKIYFFRYDPAAKVSESSQQLKQALEDFIRENPERKIRLVAHSLGGLLYREVLREPQIAQAIDRAIMIGVPFHGTPLSEAAWMRAQLKTKSVFNLLRWSHGVVVWVTRRKFPHFAEDFCWDNFDDSMPTGWYDAARCPYRPYTLEETRSLITYSSFFDADPEDLKQLFQYLDVSPFRIKDEVKNNGFSLLGKHQMMAMVNTHMARMPLSEVYQDFSTGNPVPAFPVMRFNDGVTPISSHLWLGRFLSEEERVDNPPVALWKAMKVLSGTGQARLFPHLDHRDWLEGNSRSGSPEVIDLLNPNEPERSVFDWLKYDLMRD